MSNQPKAMSHGSLFYEMSSGLSQTIRHADRDTRDVFCYFLCRRFELYIHHPKAIPSWSTCHVVFERRSLNIKSEPERTSFQPPRLCLFFFFL